MVTYILLHIVLVTEDSSLTATYRLQLEHNYIYKQEKFKYHKSAQLRMRSSNQTMKNTRIKHRKITRWPGINMPVQNS